MAKENRSKNKDATKSMLKKSVNSLKGSRTIASCNLQHAKSNVLLLKNKNSFHNVLKNTDKMMKDHCMETDFCVLRRYYKAKKNSINKKDPSNSRSKYSVNKEPILNAFEKSKTDSSACGDSKQPISLNDIEDFNANLTNLVINNLNTLLRDWIINYLSNNDDTKKKIQVILDSMLKKLEGKNNYVSSCSTYTVDIRIKESNSETNIDTNGETSQSFKFESSSRGGEVEISKCKTFSSITVPMAIRHFSIISTLSVPRYFHTCHHQMTKRNVCSSRTKIKRFYKKNIMLTLSRSNGILSNSSSLDFLEISTKSLTKHFAAYRDKNLIKRSGKRRRIVFIPSSYCKFPGSTSMAHINEERLKRKLKHDETRQPLDTLPSLVKTIFTDDMSNLGSTDESNGPDKTKDISILTDEVMTRKEERNMKQVQENSTNMSPRKTNNTASGNEPSTPQPPQTKAKTSLKRLTISDNNTSIGNVKIDDKTKVMKSFSCKACFKGKSEDNRGPPLLTIDFINADECNQCHRDEFEGESPSVVHRMNSLRKIFGIKQKEDCCRKRARGSNSVEYEKIRHKRFCYVHRKSNSNVKQKNEFLTHFQNVFNYFAHYKGKRNISLDIRINVYPVLEGGGSCRGMCTDTNRKECPKTDIYHTDSGNSSTTTLVSKQSMFKSNDNSSTKITHYCNCPPKLISIFEDTFSDRKIIENMKVGNTNLQTTYNTTRDITNKITTTTDLEIAQEVFQLRNIIRDLAVTAEKFVNEHLKNTNIRTENKKSNLDQTILFSTNVECMQTTSKDGTSKKVQENRNPSKGTQITNNLSCQNLPVIKVKKDVKNKNIRDFQARLMKKSTSYNIIDSETILKVTDMTSAAQAFHLNSVTDEALTCSLPKCKSLYDISVDSNKNKLVAFYCEELLTKIENENVRKSPSPDVTSQAQKTNCYPAKNKSSLILTSNDNKQKSTNKEVDCTKCLPNGDNNCDRNSYSCSSVFINVHDKSNENKIKIRSRRSIGFKEVLTNIKMQCLEDTDPDVKESSLTKMEPQIDLQLPDTTNNIYENDNNENDNDGSSTTDESVINLALSSASIKTLIERALSQENYDVNQSHEQTGEENFKKINSKEILNIEDSSDKCENISLVTDSLQITKFMDDIPQTCILKKPEPENLDTFSTKCSKKSLNLLSYTNLEYEILTSKSLCTLDTSINKSMNANTEKIFCQGDIINVNTAQIKTIFNTYRKPLRLNNHSDLVIRENRAIAASLKDIVSELASSFSMSTSSKKGSFSSSLDYNTSDVSNTTLTAQNTSNILIINSSSLFNQIYLESDQKFGQQHEKAIAMNETNKERFNERTNTQTPLQADKEVDKFSFRNNKVAALSVKVQSPDFCNKKHLAHSESNIQKDFRLDLSNVTCMKSVLSGTEDMFDTDELKFTKNELRETLILALDTTAKRLEDNLSEKIISIFNNSLSILSKSINIPTLKDINVKAEDKMIGDNLIKHHEVLDDKTLFTEKTTSELEIDVCLQCNLVSKSFIDDHVQKLKVENTKNQSKVKETKLIIDNLATQKSPIKQCLPEAVVKDSPIVLNKVSAVEKGERLRRFKTTLHNSFRFVVENALVIISVPSFLFVLFLLYGVILLAMKPW